MQLELCGATVTAGLSCLRLLSCMTELMAGGGLSALVSGNLLSNVVVNLTDVLVCRSQARESGGVHARIDAGWYGNVTGSSIIASNVTCVNNSIRLGEEVLGIGASFFISGKSIISSTVSASKVCHVCFLRVDFRVRNNRFSFGCSVVRLFGCSVVRLFGCSVVRLFGCSVVRLFGCSVVRLFGLI